MSCVKTTGMYASSDYYDALNPVIDLLLSQQNYAEAQVLLERLTLNFPGSTETLCRLAKVLLEQSQTPAAIEVLRRALFVDPNHFEAYVVLAGIYQAAGNVTEAISLLQSGLKREPNEPAMRRLLLDILLAERRLEEAQKLLEQWHFLPTEKGLQALLFFQISCRVWRSNAGRAALAARFSHRFDFV